MADSPVAGRLRRPGWKDPRLLGGLLLIAVSVAGVTSLVSSLDSTAPYYVARHTLTPGTVLSEDDVAVADVRVAGGTYVAVGEEPWGQVVLRTVGDGELVPAGSLAGAEDFTGRAVAVATAQPLASGIGPGSRVDLYLTSEGADGMPVTSLVAASLVVESIEESGGAFASSDAETVYLVVPFEQVEEVLDAIATHGDITVVGLAGAHT